MSFAENKIVSSGIDYITLTKHVKNESGEWWRRIETITNSERQRGSIVKGWSMAGYSGFKCGQLQFGKRDDSAIVRLSGELADLYWWDFYQESQNVSRIDLQTTVRVNGDPSAEVRKCFSHAKRYYKNRKDGPSVTLWKDVNGGATCYIGKRSSDVMLRIYNKEAESNSKAWEGCLRYEAELKRDWTRQVIGWLVAQETIHLGVAVELHTLLTKRGLRPLYKTMLPGLKIQRQAIASDVDKSLLWLSNCIGPTVRALFALGHGQSVLKCLGIQDVVQLVDVGSNGPLTSHVKEKHCEYS